jgi:hypothetical protein
MNFLVFKVKETTTNEIAFASCWINSTDAKSSRERAEQMIESNGWISLDLIEQRDVSAESYSQQHDGLAYFEQALVDDEVMALFVSKE